MTLHDVPKMFQIGVKKTKPLSNNHFPVDLKTGLECLILPTRQFVGTKCTHMLHVSFIFNCAMTLYKDNSDFSVQFQSEIESLTLRNLKMRKKRVAFSDAVHGMSRN